MNTSMTINATAMWLLALYQVVAEEQAAHGRHEPPSSRRCAALAGTTQNDIIKEYLSRGTHVFPPEHSLRLTSDLIAYTVNHLPQWNPINICSYHLQEAGATPTQELAYALCTAVAVLDTVRDSGQVAPEDFPRGGGPHVLLRQRRRAVRRGDVQDARVRPLWEEITRERYGVEDERMRRFRYGVQVNSLGLTEAQPENNVQRIVLEMLGVTLSKNARARAVQLPAWNEALGLPGRGTSSGRCACSRCWRSSPTCWSTATCSRAPPCRGQGRRPRRRVPGRRWTGCRPWAVRWPRSSPAT